jgi:ABC-type polysaccharide/polyol phosphate export permease
MVTTLALPRVLAGIERRAGGAIAITARNVAAARHSAYWMVLVSGFFEPLLYLLSIGIGVGKLVGDFRMADGTVVSYAQFVAPATLPVTVLVGFGFGALGMALSTFLRSWQDFDYMTVVQFALFLFSGTFAPAEGFPVAVRVLVEVTPLYHGVELVRGFTTGVLQWGMVWHAGYLAALAAVGLWIAGRRMGKLLLK